MFKKLAFCGLLSWLNFVSSSRGCRPFWTLVPVLLDTRWHTALRFPATLRVAHSRGQEESNKHPLQVYTISSLEKTHSRDLFSVCYTTYKYIGVLHARVFNKQIPKLTVITASWIVKTRGEETDKSLSVSPAIYTCIAFFVFPQDLFVRWWIIWWIKL